MRRKISNPLALAVLALLQEGPTHPYQMLGTLRARNKDDSINIKYGSLYTVVRALCRDGLIEEAETVREGRHPARTLYAVTELGRQETNAWLGELLGELKQEFPRFLAGLSLMPALPIATVVELLERRVEQLDARIDRYRARIAAALDEGTKELFLVEDDYRVALDDAEQAWIRELVGKIRAGTITGVDHWRRHHGL